ncbi:hypothetical protein [Clostridium sp. D33t1_170424_F3]|uniref:hypothetical protein n=1 Tax=Clostridium sp. D33t1_170424_F3 TaxID=2787099 RepID=UPI0018A8B347|nr:hypothetical protein [Clostridium sp. D33t1_170424_F3]
MDYCYGERLIAAGTAIAFQLAHDKTPEQLALLGDLFDVIGDELALLAGTKGMCKLERNNASLRDTLESK